MIRMDMRVKKKSSKNYFDKLMGFFASKHFFYAIVAITITQGLWYAFSFRPWINDEARHFENIQLYTHQLSPFLGSQNPAWDHLGGVVRDGSYMFYYLMSWPLRLLEMISSDYGFQLISLRLICLAVFIGAIIVIRKALLEVKGLSGGIVNFALLFFVLTPAVGLLAGIVNYDSAAFLLFSFLLLLSIRLLHDATLRADRIILFLIVGLFITVVKWTSIALVIPLLVYLGYHYLKKYKMNIVAAFIKSFRAIPLRTRVLLLVGLTVTASLFIERPVLNTLEYGKPAPSCEVVIGSERCKAFPDYVVYSTLKAHKNPNFDPVDPVRYTVEHWSRIMSNTMTNLLEKGRVSQLPVVSKLYEILALFSVAMILIGLKDILRSRARVMLLVIIGGFTLILIASEYGSYLKAGTPVAIRARYLIPILPLYIALTLFSINSIFYRYKKLQFSAAVLVVLVLSQGGSIVTHLITTPESAYWKGSLHANLKVKHLIEPVIKQ